jgi:hypothetical protein
MVLLRQDASFPAKSPPILFLKIIAIKKADAEASALI